ncbi:unnamed protein product [Acanthoscelides obtectus]|uniref:Uncharacterized protein n=1 Tax=Acanthoscelides obtectus TaxID=200917 RepID=A0A9P0PUA0_ACAOB|nr:unnamed protein product [Acanthoscelides obtectus]CAK1626545.1 hypothetical protein AOBTE_LOCUS3916 [Acanthoscelides obtectus]
MSIILTPKFNVFWINFQRNRLILNSDKGTFRGLRSPDLTPLRIP